MSEFSIKKTCNFGHAFKVDDICDEITGRRAWVVYRHCVYLQFRTRCFFEKKKFRMNVHVLSIVINSSGPDS